MLRGRRALSPEMALRLARLFGWFRGSGPAVRPPVR